MAALSSSIYYMNQFALRGTGVTFVLPILLNLVNQAPASDCKVDFIWAVQRDGDLSRIKEALDTLRRSSVAHNINTRIFVTRENESDHVQIALQTKSYTSRFTEDKIATSSASSSSDEFKNASNSRPGSFSIQHVASVDASPEARYPDLNARVHDFVAATVRGSTTVLTSGPSGMISDLRRIVAGCNSGHKVWKGNEGFDVKPVCDDRLEW